MEAILLREIFDLDVFGKRFALSFKLLDLGAAFFDGLLELTLLLLIGFDLLGSISWGNWICANWSSSRVSNPFWRRIWLSSSCQAGLLTRVVSAMILFL